MARGRFGDGRGRRAGCRGEGLRLRLRTPGLGCMQFWGQDKAAGVTVEELERRAGILERQGAVLREQARRLSQGENG